MRGLIDEDAFGVTFFLQVQLLERHSLRSGKDGILMSEQLENSQSEPILVLEHHESSDIINKFFFGLVEHLVLLQPI